MSTLFHPLATLQTCQPYSNFIPPAGYLTNMSTLFHPLATLYSNSYSCGITQPKFKGIASQISYTYSTKSTHSACSSIVKDMYETPNSSLYPLHRCKTLHLVRHAQGYHNVAGEKNYSAYLSDAFVDASLTPLGWQQVENLCKLVAKSDIASRIELVVTSPLTRTMQTAAGVFGGGGYIDGDLSPALMVAGAGNSDRTAISSSNCPPFIAVELCREHIGVHPCDKRKSISEYRSIFPAIDFSLIETDEDVLWAPDVREKEADIAARGRAFLNWILTRKEKEIAIFSHSSFLLYTLGLFGKDCNSLVRNEIQKPFANCELRSFVIADKSAVGTSLPITNFPGCIPPDSDVPSGHDDVDNAKI